MEEGIVYVLTNSAMPNLVKIGMTTRALVEVRMAELWTTGVPVPFECAFAGRVLDARKVERAFHIAFGPQRINASREFFEIQPLQAIGLLELMSVENLTPQINKELDKVDEASKEASKRLQARRPRLNFDDMQIPRGAMLYSTHTQEFCQVVDDRNVMFRDEVMSLTRATKLMMDNPYNVAPGPYWTYEGRRVTEIYDETYPVVEI